MLPHNEPCAALGCDHPPRGRDLYCPMHKMRIQRHGDPFGGRLRGASLRERMEQYIRVGAPDECWEWTASTKHGYGCLSHAGHMLQAHRAYYEILVAPISPGLHLDHRCHNEAMALGLCAGGVECRHRRCVNPSHLDPVRPSENTKNAAVAGSYRGLRPHRVGLRYQKARAANQ